MSRPACLFLAAGLALAGCGTEPEERAVTGAGIGAAAGAAIGAVTGISIIGGTVLGAAAGGATGALTSPDTVNLGEPIWEDGDSGQAAAASPGADSATVRSIQANLQALGYDPGPVDGILGPKTRGAIRQYQEAHGLIADGNPSRELSLHIQQSAKAEGVAAN